MYNHKEIEEEMRKFWSENQIYEKAREKGEEKIYFCDGPPYATGEIHPGTAWNKCLKDAFLRFYRMRGKKVIEKAGFDTHGLPIEVKVEQKLGIKEKKEIEEKVGIEKFIDECKNFVNKYIEIMTKQFKMFGVWMDFDNPYITYKDDYIEKSWKTIKKANDLGLLYRGEYVLPYCWRCQTTLANYELEYKEKESPSIFVKFKLKDEDKFLIIWTTTPWTLVGNVAVMVNPSEMYVEAKVGEEIWIFAKERMEEIEKIAKESIVILREFLGEELLGKKYIHPLEEEIKIKIERKVVGSEEFVTMEEGSGLVHCAPGHGQEDFMVGKKENLPVICPVNEKGVFKEEAGIFAGLHINEGSKKIVEKLKEKGALVKEGKIRHRYPHCWRCKNPLIFLATTQWFIAISKIKEKMMEEAKKVKWVPEFAKTRFLLFLESAPDWCISRQRYWGIPLPIWICKNCGAMKVVGGKRELGREIKELHKPWIDEIKFKCEKCGGEMERVKDVLDVWFDSGNAVWAGLKAEYSDFILEGHDQIRGWFYSLLGSGVIYNGKSPYKKVIMHGFFLDEKGEKMSKSVGNFIPVAEIIEKVGADAFRLYTFSNAPWEDLKFSWREAEEAKAQLNTLINMVRYLQENRGEGGEKRIEDIYMESRINTLKKKYILAMEKGHIHEAVKELRNFIMEEVSRFYMKLVKKRRKAGDFAGIQTLDYILFECIKLLAPISPHIAEYLYQNAFKRKEESIHFFEIRVEAEKIDERIEREMELVKEIISKGLLLREKTKINLRRPVKAFGIKVKKSEMEKVVEKFKEMLKEMLNAKEIAEEIFEEKEETEEFVVSINTEIDEELRKEGLFNELKRRIQVLRKKAGMKESEKATLYFSGEKEYLAILRSFSERLEREAGIVKIEEKENDGEIFKIEGKEVKMKVEKV